MNNYTPVEGQKGLYRDNDTAAIVNKDKSAYKSYMARKKALIELSKGTNSQDKAWALRNIAILMQNGISFDGIQIKTENGVKN